MESIDSTNQYKIIQDEILTLVKVDQEMRKTNIGKSHDAEKWKRIDSENANKLKRIIARIGWPTLSKVGKEASEGAWLIAQHADMDVKFQKECLELMKNESAEDVSEIDIAYLHDRICVNEGRPQFYGTQFYDNEHGAYGPRPIENPESVDERRESIGLEPLAEYKKHLEDKHK
jgi:hypothetical protein